jgi:alkylated DNA repair dioxygenase AlkB
VDLPPARVVVLEDGGDLRVWPHWIEADAATQLLETLRDGLAWGQRTLRIVGREIPEPRLTAWFGDPGAVYTYSGLTLAPEPWPTALAGLRARLEAELGHRYNSVLCNLYRDGSDSVGFHADDEPELGAQPIIASVSLGATRRFVLKHKRRKSLAPVTFELASGTLLVMGGATQRHWVHALPKQRGIAAPRVNLTFRLVQGREG